MKPLLGLYFALLVAFTSSPSEAQMDCEGAIKGGSFLPTARYGVVIPIGSSRTKVFSGLYQGCTRIFNDVVISGLSINDDTSFLSEIEEVYGRLDIYNNDLTEISLPKLRIVRGQNLLLGKYAIALSGNPNLQYFSAPNLRAIEAGSVDLTMNPNLRCARQIGWSDMMGGRTSTSVSYSNTGEDNPCPCAAECSGQCFGPGIANCYTNTSFGCPMGCSDRCNMEVAQPYCCYRECAAGCTGPRRTECLACKGKQEMLQDGSITCVESCPLLTKLDESTNTEVANPDGRYNFRLECVANCSNVSADVSYVAYKQDCVRVCPQFYQVGAGGVCELCGTACAHDCLGTNRLPNNRADLSYLQNNVTGCTRIVGDLYLALGFAFYPVNSPFEIPYAEYESLSSVQEITGCLVIDGASTPDLAFLRNLKSVGSCIGTSYQAYYLSFSISIVGSASEIEYMGWRSLQRTKLPVIFHRLPKMCYFRTLNWTAANILPNATSPRISSVSSNCTGRVCNSLCTDIGCLGPGPDHCHSCTTASYQGTCINDCSEALTLFNETRPVYLDSATRECRVCNDVCGATGCTGPANTDCKSCPHKSLGTACYTSCPPETYETTGNRCQACNVACRSQPGLPLSCTGSGSNLGPGGCKECELGVFNSLGQLEYCVIACPLETTYTSTRVSGGVQACEYCDPQCVGGCSGPAASACTGCRNQYRQSGTIKTCVASCNANEYMASDGACVSCDQQCDKCSGSGPSACTKCKNSFIMRSQSDRECVHNCSVDGYTFIGSATDFGLPCLQHCPDGTFPNEQKICKPCDALCELNCTGAGSGTETCRGRCRFYSQDSNCVESCGENYNTDDESKTCRQPDEPNEENSETQTSTKSLVGVIAGASVGGVFVVLLVVGSLYVYCRRQSKIEPVTELEIGGSANPNYGVAMEMVMNSETLQASAPQADPNMAQLVLAQEKEICIGRELGEGAFGTVYEGTWTPADSNVTTDVAVKVLKENTGAASNKEILDEAVVMASVNHPHLVRLLCLCMAPRVMLLTELMGLGSLLGYLRSRKRTLTGETLLLFGKQIAAGMEYLEFKRLIHRDLAARNVLVAEHRCVKITDFGLARLLDVGSEKFQHDGGKMPVKWLAPECMQDKVFTHQTDVWSFGVTMWEVFTFGNAPFKGFKAQEIFSILMSGERLPKPRVVSSDMYETVEQCWKWAAEERPTFTELVARFNVMCENPGPFCATKADKEGRRFETAEDFQATAPELVGIDDDGYERHFDVMSNRSSSAEYDNFVPPGGNQGNSFPSRDTLPGNIGAAVSPPRSLDQVNEPGYEYDNMPERPVGHPNVSLTTNAAYGSSPASQRYATSDEARRQMSMSARSPVGLAEPVEDALYDNRPLVVDESGSRYASSDQLMLPDDGYQEPLTPDMSVMRRNESMSSTDRLLSSDSNQTRMQRDSFVPGDENPYAMSVDDTPANPYVMS